MGSDALWGMACPADAPAHAVLLASKPQTSLGALSAPGVSVPTAASAAEGNLVSDSVGFMCTSCTGPGPAGVRDYGASCLLGMQNTVHLVHFCTGFSLKNNSQPC